MLPKKTHSSLLAFCLLTLCLMALARCTSLEDSADSETANRSSSSMPGDGQGSKPPPPAPAAQDTNAQSEMLKKRVLILPFENITEFPLEALQDAVQSELRSAVGQNSQLALVEPDSFAPPELQAPVRLGKPTDRQLELAHLLGANAVITGTLREIQVRQQADEIGILSSKRFEAKARVWLRVTDVVTQKELFGREFTATANEERVDSLDRSISAQTELGKSAVLKALRGLATGIAQVSGKIAWTGRIARVDYQKFYINGGRKSGVFPGLLLKVYSPPQDISDRTTGQSLGMAPGRFKGYLKVMENFGEDASVAILHLGAGFREEDFVEPHFPEQN
jgi:TolB-like protein